MATPCGDAPTTTVALLERVTPAAGRRVRRRPRATADPKERAVERTDTRVEEILACLRERAKELNCLFAVDDLLNRDDTPAESLYAEVVSAIPRGMQYPQLCKASLAMRGRLYCTPGLEPTPWAMRAAVRVHGQVVGELSVYYDEELPEAGEGPFLQEERRLLDALAERIGYFEIKRELYLGRTSWDAAMRHIASHPAREWQVVIDFLRETDIALARRLTRKMINHLCWNGVPEAPELLAGCRCSAPPVEHLDGPPAARADAVDPGCLAQRTFEMAAAHLGDDEVLGCLRQWLTEDRSRALIATMTSADSSLSELTGALERYEALGIDERRHPPALQSALRESLLRRLFSDLVEFVNTARQYVRVSDFVELRQCIVAPPNSRGKMGGKSAGLFVARKVIERSEEVAAVLGDVKVPRTWYVASDGLNRFVDHNDLEDVYYRKYLPIEQVSREYPYIVQLFKNSSFPPDMSDGLDEILADMGDVPLIVRSSSLLEDRTGAAFSGKYRSLFLANQGTLEQRRAALEEAIAEVYASVFGPDPLQYRAERGLLGFHEEMGILVQEVVGRRVGKYFLPAYAGVAFSNNEFRWSPRIRRHDGLVRLVPGLGTRAVDRLTDDYPVLAVPRQPGLRVNATLEEVLHYSPRKIDVIDLEAGRFRTVQIDELLAECGSGYPLVCQVVSEVDGDRLRTPGPMDLDFGTKHYAVTFQGLLGDGRFLPRIRTLLDVLEDKLHVPIDIEFACDGKDFYLLQCRAQSFAPEESPAEIPRDVPPERVVFSAHRYVSDGCVPDITHIVYVDPARYKALPDLDSLRDVGRAIGRLNTALPRRRFILMGPGRWGSRGDIQLGVNVTYADVSNTAVLVEIARQRGNYIPDLSFGTHFFQDLVEARIRYLPLYPDDPGVAFNEAFLLGGRNRLPDLVPDMAHVGDTVRVIDVPAETGGLVLRVLMNSEQDEALGLLAPREVDEAARGASAG